MKRERSFWKRSRGLLIVGTIVLLLAAMGGGFALTKALTQGQDCGKIGVTTVGLSQFAIVPYAEVNQDKPVKQVEQCFVQAYHQCQSASVSITWMGVDFGTNETLTVAPQQGHCQIMSSSQDYDAVEPQWWSVTRTDTCQGLTLTATSLVMRQCGKIHELIPLAEYCGSVDDDHTAGRNKQEEECFAQDKQQCTPAVLMFGPRSATGPAYSYQFAVDGTCHMLWKATIVPSGKPSIETPVVPCTGMTQQVNPDRLVFQGCHASGGISVPIVPTA